MRGRNMVYIHIIIQCDTICKVYTHKLYNKFSRVLELSFASKILCFPISSEIQHSVQDNFSVFIFRCTIKCSLDPYTKM